jgi:hypothetical protein
MPDSDPFLARPARDISPPDESVFFSAIVRSSDDAILSKTLDGTITSWNEGAARMYGYTPEEAIGSNIRMLVPPDRTGEVDEILARIRRGEKVEHFETIRHRKDGSALSVSVSISPLQDASGTIVGASTIARDITDRKEAEAALALYTRQVEQSNRDLERFAYVVSHDLAEPLRMISSFVQLLSEEIGADAAPAAREYVGFVLDGTTRMRALIDDLLEYSRVGSEDLAHARVDLGAVMERVLEVLDHQLLESGARVVTGYLPEVVADPIKIEQVFRNLVGNAVKFRRAGVAPVVEVTSERDEGAWRITVADDGIGIDPAYAGRVFEMFQRLHTSGDYPGTGVGLSICRRIVDRHGGSIWIDPDADAGARIHFTIPDHEALGGTVVNVLVVEDNPGDVLLMRQGLATWSEATEVHVVSNGEEALRFLAQGLDGSVPLPDLVILDVNLPRVSGTQVLSRMRADPLLERVPVAVMSSSSFEAGAVAAYDARTTCFVAKPMDVPDYRAAIRSIERFWRVASKRG